MRKKLIASIIIFCFIPFVIRGPLARAVESIGMFIIEDIEYQNFQDRVRLSIVMNDYIECISYELENPHRVIIDPLEEVYCDYEDKVYFDDGLIKSIEFIKTKNEKKGLDERYYAFDFLAVELNKPASYEIKNEGPNILLDINRIPELEKEAEVGTHEEEITKIAQVKEEKIEPPIATEEKPLEKEKPSEEEKSVPVDLNKVLSLEDCIKIAIENHTPLKIAEEQIKLARLKVNESFRELFPVASLLWSESKGRISNSLYRGRKYGFEFKQPLFHGGELFFTWEQAKTNLSVTQENYNKVKEDLVHEVSKAYYNLAKALNNLDIQKELYEYIKSDMELAKKEYDLDLSTQLENLSAQTSYDQAYYSVAASENNASLKKLALNKIMNIDMTAELKIGYKLEFKKFDINIDDCIVLAMQNRTELKTKELMVKSSELGERIAKSQLWPQLDVVGKYVKAAEEYEPRALGWNLRNERFLGVTLDIPLADHTFSIAHKRGKLAPTVTTYESNTEYNTDLYKITPFDDLSRYTNAKSAYIAHQQALSDLNDVKRKINSDVREAFYSLQEAQIKLNGSLNNLKLYEKELLAAQVKKEMNEATVSEVMDAKIKFFSEKTNYINALGDIFLAVASLNQAVGIGGYFK